MRHLKLCDRLLSEPPGHTKRQTDFKTDGRTDGGDAIRPTDTSALQHSDDLENTVTIHCLLCRSESNNVCKYFPNLVLG